MRALVDGEIRPNWPQIQLLATVAIPLLIASCVPAQTNGRIASAASVKDLPTNVPFSPDVEPTDPELRERMSEQVAEWLAPVSGEPAAPFNAASMSSEDQQRSLNCLTAAIYYEARSESEDGQRAVAQVVLNRVRHPAFPSSVCGVVFQGAERRTGCQFSFTCDGSMRRRRDTMSWIQARRIATEALAGEVFARVGNATHYHTTAIMPYWASHLKESAIVGSHIFYRWAGSAGEASAFRQHYGGLEPDMALWTKSGSDPQGVRVHRGSSDAGQQHVAVGNSDTGVTIHRGMTPPAPNEADETEGEEAVVKAAEPEFANGVRIHRGAFQAGR